MRPGLTDVTVDSTDRTLARDIAIKTMGPRRMLARQDWIYDWRV